MTPVLRLIRRVWETTRSRFYEGPEPPARIVRMVFLFARSHSVASRREWAEFAAILGQECYRTGYVRGAESAERWWRAPHPTPEEVADLEVPWWRDAGEVSLSDPDAVVLESDAAVVRYNDGTGGER